MNLWIRHDGTELTTDTDGFTVDTATEPDEPEPGEAEPGQAEPPEDEDTP